MTPPPQQSAAYAACLAEGCGRAPRPFSRFCTTHHRRLERTRALDGRLVTKGEIRPHRELAADFLTRNAEHPATTHALDFLRALLDPGAKAGFLHAELTRLRNGGALPGAMLASCVAMYGFHEWTPKPLADRCFDLNLGRAVLNTVPARKALSRNGKPYYRRVRASHAEALGRILRETLGTFCLLAARQIHSEVNAAEMARARVRSALSVPFTPLKEP